jgi:hypothetical protein
MARRKGAKAKPRGPLPQRASVLRVQQGKEKYPATTREGQYTEEIVTVRRLEGRQMVSGSVGSVERAISMLEANNFSIGVDKVAGIVGCNPVELQRALEARGYRWLSEERKVVQVEAKLGERGLSYGTKAAQEMIADYMERKSVSRREAINALANEGSLRTLSEVQQPQPRGEVSLAEKQAQSEQAGIRAEARRLVKESGGKVSYQDALRAAMRRNTLRVGRAKV